MEIIINEPCTFGKWQGKPLLWQPISNKDGCTLLVTMEALEARMAHNENGNTSWESANRSRAFSAKSASTVCFDTVTKVTSSQ